jgi:hypothetical protein
MAEADFIQPRYAILEMWRAVVRRTIRSGRWDWGPDEVRDSVSDAEQLLCILFPATNRPELRLEDPNSIPNDVLDVLRPMGDSVQIPRTLVVAVEGFVSRHTSVDGAPAFGIGAAYALGEDDEAAEPSPDQAALDNVVSYATSINLCLSVLGFLLRYRERGARGDWVARVDALTPKVRQRLTAALTGLLRSFTMNTTGTESDEGRELIRQLNQESRPEHTVVSDFNQRMQVVRGRLREARLGVARADDLENPNLLFEIGWTWSIAEDAPAFRLDDESDDESEAPTPGETASTQRKGYALSKPYLYFTLVALEAIELLSSERTRVLGLLDARQERLASALFIRRDLTQIYWSQLARFGPGRWPLEDLPWRTVDGVESDYLSLLVCAVVLQDLARREANEDDLRRLQPLLSELANRGRITRRALLGDQALQIHHPGLLVTLEGSERLGPQLLWRLTDFAPLLLRRVALAASLTSDQQRRDELLSLATAIWGHVAQRAFARGEFQGLWDDPTRVYVQLEPTAVRPSWTMSFRAVEALVGTWASQANRATRNQDLGSFAAAMISEAEYKVNQELAYTVALQTPLQSTLQELRLAVSRAKSLSETQPATAMALCVPILEELDRISQGRGDALRAE